MPSTVRVSIALTTPETGSNDNVDALIQGQHGRRQRWSVPFNAVSFQFDWPITSEKNVFMQAWQLQSNVGDSNFKVSHPGSDGWACLIPPIGSVFFMLRQPPGTSVIFIDSDNAVEMDVVFF